MGIPYQVPTNQFATRIQNCAVRSFSLDNANHNNDNDENNDNDNDDFLLYFGKYSYFPFYIIW